MPRRPRRNHSPAFKAKGVLGAVRGEAIAPLLRYRAPFKTADALGKNRKNLINAGQMPPGNPSDARSTPLGLLPMCYLNGLTRIFWSGN